MLILMYLFPGMGCHLDNVNGSYYTRPLALHPLLQNYPHPKERMVVRPTNLAALMPPTPPRISQSRSIVLSTGPREVVTSALMAILRVNSSCTKREIALMNSCIPPLHFLLLLGSSERIITFSLFNCIFSLNLSLVNTSPHPWKPPN